MSQKQKKDTSNKKVAKPYEPTPHERERLDAYLAEKKENPLPPRMKISTKGGGVKLEPDHPDVAVGSLLLISPLTKSALDACGVV